METFRSRRFGQIEPLEARRLLTVLTFDPVSADSVVLPTGYGDRVVSASQGGFTYATAGGATPEVTASYGPNPANVRQFKAGYGDLHDVIFAGDSAGGILEITLSADLGFQASLSSLELGGKQSDLTINSLQVFDGGSNVLFTKSNIAIGDINQSGGGHTLITFPSLHSRVLRIRIDASNLGANGDQVGVDNVQFSQITGASAVGDGYADVVIGFHDAKTGPIAGPYGGDSSEESASPVSLGVVLGGDPDSPDYLSLPTGSSVTVAFADETVVDGPGPDLAIPELVDSGERAKVYVSSDYENFTFLGTAKSGRTNKFDLASIDYEQPVRAVKIVGEDNFGGSPGFDLVNVQALPSAMRPESFRFPIGDGSSVPTIVTQFGSGDGYLAEDYATPIGKVVHPFMFGTVVNEGFSDAIGNYVNVQHRLPDGTLLESVYGNLSSIAVKIGDEVTTDSKLGLSGSNAQFPTGVFTFQVYQDPASSGGIVGIDSGAAFSSGNLSEDVTVGSETFQVFKPSTFVTSTAPLNVAFAQISSDGTLSVDGTAGDDQINLSAINGSLSVTRNGITRVFAQSIVNSIQISAQAGNDNVSIGSGVIETYIDGGDGNDLLSGGDGNDTLTGGAGKNTLLGNGGDDRLNGSGSRDSLDGGDGDDRLYGNDGDDTLTGDAGVDRLFGGNGNDSLSGGSSNDKLYGEAGNDTLDGGNQNDLLDGGSGNDSIIGGSGSDTITGDAGNDTISAQDGTADSVDGGSGTDQALLDKIDHATSIETIL